MPRKDLVMKSSNFKKLQRYAVNLCSFSYKRSKCPRRFSALDPEASHACSVRPCRKSEGGFVCLFVFSFRENSISRKAQK